jgi:homoserine O-acetyltransferase
VTTRYLELPGIFRLEGGGRLDGVRVAYRTWGEPKAEATLICHALTGSADADDWWGGLFGPGRVFDPYRDYIVAVNVLGGCSGTTGPTSAQPGRLAPYGPDFPDVSIRDMVRLQSLVLSHLGVARLRLVIGGSMGGMQTLEWALMYPERVDAIVPIGVGAAQSPWAIALSETQRQAIVTDPRFRNGRYRKGRGPDDGLATARMIAMCSYRSPDNFATRFGRVEQDEGGFAVQSYLRHQGAKLVERFDANTYLALLSSMDGYDLGRGRGPTEAVLRHVSTPALAVGISSDALYPAREVEELARSLGNAEFALLEAPQGHDAFLIETDRLNDLVVDWIRRRSDETPVASKRHASATGSIG